MENKVTYKANITAGNILCFSFRSRLARLKV